MRLPYKFLPLLFLCLVFGLSLSAHNPDDHGAVLREWTLADGGKIDASFLVLKQEMVVLETKNGIRQIPLSSLCNADRQFILQRQALIRQLNGQVGAAPASNKSIHQTIQHTDYSSDFAALCSIFLLFSIPGLFLIRQHRFRYLTGAVLAVLAITGYAFRKKPFDKLCTVTDPLTIDSAFTPFKPNVVTSWDDTYFYVQSKGIPTTHPMMAGIVSWQQQVPIPQCYTGSNAWSIPLNPVLAATPVPVNPNHFIRGAVAVAANGIPIFNPYTNTGVDALTTGQLDNWGGHCGRADDYHYHVAPLHLYDFTAPTLPIAWALDGFAVYGPKEPDGSTMAPLDANHGHFAADGVYHYHGTAAAPYMIGNMVGVVTEDNTMQIVPQAHAKPVRPSLTPLQGAKITDCSPNGPNGYVVTYQLNGQTHQVDYNWTSDGVYTFHFIDPGSTTTATYNGAGPCALPVGVRDTPWDKNGVVIYPNPSGTAFSIRLAENADAASIDGITIFSMEGKSLFHSDKYRETFDLSGFAKGVYLVSIKKGAALLTKKLIVR